MPKSVQLRANTAIAGTSGRALVKIENDGNQAYKAPAEVKFFLSADSALDDGDTPLGKLNRVLKLLPGHAKSVTASVNYPRTATDGAYYLLADVEPAAVGAPGGNPAHTPASAPLTIQAAQVDLAGNDSGIGGALSHIPQFVHAAGAMSIVLHIGNTGNAAADGELAYVFSVKRIDAPESDPATELVSVTRHVRLGTHGHAKFKTPVVLPASLAPGSYVLRATLDTGNVFNETNEANNTVTAKVPLSVI
jgi:hypothetical protein